MFGLSALQFWPECWPCWRATPPPAPRPWPPSSISILTWIHFWIPAGGRCSEWPPHSNWFWWSAGRCDCSARWPFERGHVPYFSSFAWILPNLPSHPWRWARPPDPCVPSRRFPAFLSRSLCAQSFHLQGFSHSVDLVKNSAGFVPCYDCISSGCLRYLLTSWFNTDDSL